MKHVCAAGTIFISHIFLGTFLYSWRIAYQNSTVMSMQGK